MSTASSRTSSDSRGGDLWSRWMERGLDRALLGLVLVLPWVPLVASESFYFPFVTPRAYLFRTVVEAMVLVWALAVVLGSRPSEKPGGVVLSYLALATWALVADLGAGNAERSLLGDLERMGGFATTAHLAAALVVSASCLRPPGRWRLLTVSSLAASCVPATLACLQAVGARPLDHLSGRVDGGLGNPVFLAGYLLMHVFMAAFLVVAGSPPRWLRTAALAIGGLDAAVLILSATRSAMLGLLAGGVLCLIAGAKERRRRRMLAAVLGLALLLVGLFGTALVPADCETGFLALDRVLASSWSDPSIRTRLLIWRMALKGFLEHPVLGWGEEGFLDLANRHYDPALWFQPERYFDRPHCVPLGWLTAAGIPGALAFLAVLGTALRGVIRAPGLTRGGRVVLAGWLTAYVVHSAFAVEDLSVAVLFVVFLALVESFERVAPATGNAAPGRWPAIAVAALAVGAAVWAFPATVFSPLRSERTLVDGLRRFASQPAAALGRFEAALHGSPVVAPYACEQLLLGVSSWVVRPEITAESRQRLAAGAQEVAEDFLRRVPGDLKRRLILARLLLRTGQPVSARRHLEIAHSLAPGRNDVLLELATAELNAGNCELALDRARETHERCPEDPQAVDALALVALYCGENELADELLRSFYGTPFVADERFVTARAASGDFAAVVATVAAVPPNRPKLQGRIVARAVQEIRAAAARRPEWHERAAAALFGILEAVP